MCILLIFPEVRLCFLHLLTPRVKKKSLRTLLFQNLLCDYASTYPPPCVRLPSDFIMQLNVLMINWNKATDVDKISGYTYIILT